MPSILSSSLTLAPSTLFVRDLTTMTSFYHDMVGLEILEQGASRTLLGRDHIGIIELVAQPKLTFASPRAAGLFHNAIVFDSRGDLSRTVDTILTSQPRLYSGTGDHLVSEAFYFTDPEGNGLELYFDRPANTWTWINGHVQMDTLYIDPLAYISANASTKGTNQAKLGHVHLKIGDIERARRFYIDLLGFDVTADMGSALFISISGYHHHLGLNTWLSQDAPRRSTTLGLSSVDIRLASDSDIRELATRLENAQYPFTFAHGIMTVDDPWGNTLILHST